MIVPTVPATTARRSCTRCSASDRRGMEISDVVIVSSLRRALLAAKAAAGALQDGDVISCGGARTRRPRGGCVRLAPRRSACRRRHGLAAARMGATPPDLWDLSACRDEFL